MKSGPKPWYWALGLFGALALLTAATCWDVLSNPDQVLAFNDLNVEAALMPSYRFPDTFLRSWDNQLFFGFGNKQTAWALSFVGDTLAPIFWRRGGLTLILPLAGLALYWMLRQYRFRRGACALTAAVLVMTGWCHNFYIAGQVWRPICLAWTALALGFLERGRQQATAGRRPLMAWLSYALAGGCLGLNVSEWPDIGFILAIAAAFVFWFTHLADYWAPRQSGTPTRSTTDGPTDAAAPRLTFLAIASRFALLVGVSILLAWQTVSTVFATNIQGVKQGGSGDAAARYAWATQWSVPPAESWNIVSGNYFGSSVRSETHPYWGRNGRDAGWETTRQGFRNFNMCGWHLGVIPSILLLGAVVGLFRRKSDGVGSAFGNARPAVGDAAPSLRPSALALMVTVGCLGSLMMMWGKFFPLYRLFWSLPYFDTFRNPDKWDGPFVLLAGLGMALMLDSFLRPVAPAEDGARGRRSKRPAAATPHPARAPLLAAAGIIGGLGLLILAGTFTGRTSFLNQLLSEGYGAAATTAWDQAIVASIKVVLLSAAFGGLVLWLLRPPPPVPAESTQTPAAPAPVGHTTTWVWPLGLGLLALLTIGDLYFDNRPFVMGHKFSQFLAPNPLTDYLDAHRTEGRIKLLPPRQPLLNSLRLTLLTIKGYDLFEPVAVSRLPTDYEALFNALEKNPVRLWELGALRYFLTLPGAEQELNKLDGQRGRFVERLAVGVGVVNDAYVPQADAPPDQRYLRVLEFTGALPKYLVVGSVTNVPAGPAGDTLALRLLAERDFQPATQAIIHDEKSLGALAAAPATALAVQQESSVDVRLSARLVQPGLLVRATRYDPDWQVRIDGRRAELLRVNYLFQGVWLPAGEHSITFSYRPPLAALNVALGGRIGLLLLFCIFLVAGRKTDS